MRKYPERLFEKSLEISIFKLCLNECLTQGYTPYFILGSSRPILFSRHHDFLKCKNFPKCLNLSEYSCK